MQVAARSTFRLIPALEQSRARQAYELILCGLALLSIVFGFDKFFGFLGVEWRLYVAPALGRQASALQIAMLFGAFQVVIGFVLFVRPRLGAWLTLASWCGVVVNALIAMRWGLALHAVVLVAVAVALLKLTRRFGTDLADAPPINAVGAG